ncbi:MAG: TonB family protein [Polyangiaceae bacterium]
MKREHKTPLVLWIVVIQMAVTAHLAGGAGGWLGAVVHDDHRALANLGVSIQEKVRMSEATFEVGSIDIGAKPAEAEVVPPPPPPVPPKVAEKPKEKPPEPTKPPVPPKEEKKVAVVVKKAEEKKPQAPLQQPQMDKRIAVRQHVQKKQEDNPTARFVGDDANHVEQETVATQTSHDQDDPNPTPGGNHSGPNQNMGDSDHTKIADSEEHAGDRNRAPGEKGAELNIQKDPPPDKPMGAVAVQAPSTPEPPRVGGDGRTPTPSQNPNPELPQPSAASENPDVNPLQSGTWSFNPIRPGATAGGAANTGNAVEPPKTPGQRPSPTKWLGLGGRPGPGQINLNLNQTGVVAVVGQAEFKKEREADGERRKSEHRGSWTASNFERWRSAIENYVSTVKPGNQTALNTAAVPFATYLNGMHNRIHPLFADSFLGSLGGLPPSNPLNDPKLITRLEIVLTKDGHLVKMGIVKTSGVTAFDIAALDAVQRASPFGSAPGAIVSPDGKVYLHWEFHRDEVYACSTMFARPFLLNVPPTSPPVDPNPGPQPNVPSPSKERGLPANHPGDVREGLLLAPTERPYLSAR